MPWVVTKSATGTLKAKGRLSIRVRGLVENTGTNDEPSFRALLSCLTETGLGVSNLLTPPFPANERGNANITAQLLLPNPCVAPIIMITDESGEKWFAITGLETP